MRQQSNERSPNARLAALALAVGLAGLLALAVACARPKPGTFATPEAAVAELAATVGLRDDARTNALFGPGAAEMFQTGDADEDHAMAERVKKMIAEKVAFEDIDADTKVAVFGAKEWPFPIPLVRDGGRWRFDGAAGREELLNRRVGYYELATLDSLHAYVDAQREYASVGRDGRPPAFAQRFLSTPGRHDGLYWQVAEGEPTSPLGDLLAEAAEGRDGGPRPYRGYNYRILTAQGSAAPGGAKKFIDGAGDMTGGFAAIAWPAKYGNSGVMTFLVGSRGMVYQKDLGPQTAELAPKIVDFEPDASWAPTGETLASAIGADDDLGALADR